MRRQTIRTYRALVETVIVRSATEKDVSAVADIGAPGMLAQYAGLVDSRAVQAAADQLYAPDAVSDCIARTGSAPDALFLVAERGGRVDGFLHFDSFGPEPELHRLYCSPHARGLGVGGLLMDALHREIAPDLPYMLLVAEGNDRAVAFYERHGLRIEALVDGVRYYAERMGVRFPSDTKPFRLVLMRAAPRTRRIGELQSKSRVSSAGGADP